MNYLFIYYWIAIDLIFEFLPVSYCPPLQKDTSPRLNHENSKFKLIFGQKFDGPSLEEKKEE